MNPSKIVITGTIASGKSTLSKILADMGFEVISADEVNRNLLLPGMANYEAIKNSGYFDEVFKDEILDKKELAKIIFTDREKMMVLNSLTHPNIMSEVDRLANLSQRKVVFIEIPLYFQSENRYEADEVWVVMADYETQLKRLVERDEIDLDYAKSKIETQEDLKIMKDEADVIFDNSGSKSDLEEQVRNVLLEKDLL